MYVSSRHSRYASVPARIVEKIHHQWAFLSLSPTPATMPANGFDPQLWINYHLQNNKWFANDLQAILLWVLMMMMMVCAERESEKGNMLCSCFPVKSLLNIVANEISIKQ